jgi:hypothetical protein
LHPTFQEYFAALAIDDWDYFLPRNHLNKPIKGKEYRIFKPHWKEVILFWFGSTDKVINKSKRYFLDKLISFQSKDFDFHQFQANFLAAACTSEYVAHSQIKRIIHWLATLAFNTDHWDAPASQAARRVISEIHREMAVSELLESSQGCKDSLSQRFLIQGLAEISSGEEKVVKHLISFICFPDNELNTYSYDSRHYQAIEGLGDIGRGSLNARNALEKLYSSENIDSYTRKLAAMSLYKIAPEVFPELFEFAKDLRKSREVNLSKVEENIAACPNSIPELIALLRDESKDVSLRVRASAKLSKLEGLNGKQISELLDLLFNSSEFLTRFLAAQVLEDAANRGFQSFIVSVISKQSVFSARSKDFDLYCLCYKIVWKCAQNTGYLDFHQAWNCYCP